MTRDRFDADFHLDMARPAVWQRLTERPIGADDRAELVVDSKLWLAGFDAVATIVDIDAPARLHTVKDHDPCAGTTIAVRLTEDGTGTRVDVSQADFGDWLASMYEVIGIGWRHIVADLHAFLRSGVHPGRHSRPWGDLGAAAGTADGGVRIDAVMPGGLAERVGLVAGDVLVVVCGAPVSSLDDLFTALRIVQHTGVRFDAEWIRAGELVVGSVS